MKQRIRLQAKANTSMTQRYMNKMKADKYPQVTWGVFRYPMCAVVGGGQSAKDNINILRNWEGHIFGVNDMAGWLSDHGVKNTLYAIDATPNLYKTGKKVKGAIFATCVHPNQFIYKKIRVFDMGEEDVTGIKGGPTAVCRAPHLFLRMGYRGITFFGIDGSFGDNTHLSGMQDVAFSDMIIVKAGGIEYFTNASLMMQNEAMVKLFTKYPQFLVNGSGGLLKAMLENPDTWEVVAISEDLKKKYDDLGCTVWSKPYNLEEKTWQMQQQ